MLSVNLRLKLNVRTVTSRLRVEHIKSWFMTKKGGRGVWSTKHNNVEDKPTISLIKFPAARAAPGGAVRDPELLLTKDSTSLWFSLGPATKNNLVIEVFCWIVDLIEVLAWLI